MKKFVAALFLGMFVASVSPLLADGMDHPMDHPMEHHIIHHRHHRHIIIRHHHHMVVEHHDMPVNHP